MKAMLLFIFLFSTSFMSFTSSAEAPSPIEIYAQALTLQIKQEIATVIKNNDGITIDPSQFELPAALGGGGVNYLINDATVVTGTKSYPFSFVFVEQPSNNCGRHCLPLAYSIKGTKLYDNWGNYAGTRYDVVAGTALAIKYPTNLGVSSVVKIIYKPTSKIVSTMYVPQLLRWSYVGK